MLKVAVVILADTETRGDLGRLANALEAARELKEAGDEVKVIFDGAGTKWVPVLADSAHKYHRTFTELREVVAGACAYCARAFGVLEQVEAAGIPLLKEYRDHPSLRALMAEGYRVLTF